MDTDRSYGAALIRRIDQVEGFSNHVLEEIDPTLWQGAFKGIADACHDTDWEAHGDPVDYDLWLARRTWIQADAHPADATFRLVLDARQGPSGQGESSWLATFTQTGPNGGHLGFWVEQTIVSPPRWHTLLNEHPELIADLNAAKFSIIGDDDRRLCLGFYLWHERLAWDFASGLATGVSAHIGQVVGWVLAATPQLERLRALALAAVENEGEHSDQSVASVVH